MSTLENLIKELENNGPQDLVKKSPSHLEFNLNGKEITFIENYAPKDEGTNKSIYSYYLLVNSNGSFEDFKVQENNSEDKVNYEALKGYFESLSKKAKN